MILDINEKVTLLSKRIIGAFTEQKPLLGINSFITCEDGVYGLKIIVGEYFSGSKQLKINLFNDGSGYCAYTDGKTIIGTDKDCDSVCEEILTKYINYF